MNESSKVSVVHGLALAGQCGIFGCQQAATLGLWHRVLQRCVAKNPMVERKMVELKDVDLRADPEAASFIKTEVVSVQFALQDGELLSLEGPNRYHAGDALVSAQGGNRWSVSRERFEHKYQPVPPTVMGQNGAYQARPIPVLAKRIEHAFSIARCAGGDRLQGQPGDWLLQYAPGDFGLAAQSRFAQVYRKVD